MPKSKVAPTTQDRIELGKALDGVLYALGSDGSKWGWAHLALGVAAVVAGAALRGRADWARGVAVIVATLSMFAAFLWLPYNAAGAIVILALDFFVMWAAFADLDSNAP